MKLHDFFFFFFYFQDVSVSEDGSEPIFDLSAAASPLKGTHTETLGYSSSIDASITDSSLLKTLTSTQ